MTFDEPLQTRAHIGELLERHGRHVHLAARIAALAAMQSRDRKIGCAEQPVEIRDRAAADECNSALRGRPKPPDERHEVRFHCHRMRMVRKFQQRSIHVEKQAPMTCRLRNRVYGRRIWLCQLHHGRSIRTAARMLR